MERGDSPRLVSLAQRLLNKACEENRHREAEIMQGIDGEKEHAECVLSWVEKLSPNPSPALKIAALFHDIDRIVTPHLGGGFKGDRRSKEYYEHKKAHAKRSADYVCPKLLTCGVNPQIVERIGFLISHHDDIGEEVNELNDDELNILVAADSFAFFTSIAPELYQKEGEDRLRDKIRFMVEKMPSFAKDLLASHKVENKFFDRIKNEIIAELGRPN